MESIKISIVVPIHNDEEYVRACVERLINQTLKDIEIFLVNDASTDNSLSIMEEYANLDKRIHVISFDENRSAFQARKVGIENSHGKYIMFADADDLLELNACEILWKLEQENPVDILHFGTNVITDSKDKARIDGYKRLINPRKELLYCGEIFDAFVSRNFEGHLWNKIFNRELCIYALEKAEDIVLPKGQDKYFYWIMAFYARTYRGCPEYNLYNYRYGLGVESAGGHIGLDKFELFCKQSWTEDAIERFMISNSKEAGYEKILEKSRKNLLRHCVKNWKNLSDEDKILGLDMIKEYWKKPEDIGEFVGALCDHYRNDQDSLIAIMKQYNLKKPLIKKQIHTIATYYHIYNNGGIQRVISRLMAIWLESGYNVILITDYEKENDYEVPDGVVRVNCKKSGNASAKDYAGRGRELENILREYNVDVMIYHDYLSKSLLWDLLLSKSMNIPFLIYYHNVFTKYIIFGDERFYTIPKIAQLSDGMAVLSKIDECFWKNFNQNVHFVNNPLTFDLSKVKKASLDGKIIIWVGRLDELHKRFQEPVTIMREVIKRVPDAKLFIVGKDESGKNFKRLQNRIAKLHLEDTVILCGFQKDVAPFYESASVYLMTSTHEGSPMTLIEGLSFGLPTVMYDLPYLALVQNNKGIISIQQGDVIKAAEAICELLEDKEYRIEVGESGRKFLENVYINDNISDKWEEIFKSFSIHQKQCSENNVEYILWDTLLMHFKFLLENNNYGQISSVNDYSDECQKLKREINLKNQEIEQLNICKFALEETRKSFSYKLGLTLTAIPRKIKELFKKDKNKIRGDI